MRKESLKKFRFVLGSQLGTEQCVKLVLNILGKDKDETMHI